MGILLMKPTATGKKPLEKIKRKTERGGRERELVDNSKHMMMDYGSLHAASPCIKWGLHLTGGGGETQLTGQNKVWLDSLQTRSYSKDKLNKLSLVPVLYCPHLNKRKKP
jgi:hypothetical protein